MKILDFIIIRFTILLIIGIICAHFIELPPIFTLIASIFSISILGLIHVGFRKSFKRYTFFGLIGYITVFCIGLNSYNFHNPKNFESHYTNRPLDLSQHHILGLRIIKKLKPTFFQDKYEVEIKSINDDEASGKLLLNVNSDSLQKKLEVDDFIILSTLLKEINAPLNPGQFNYKDYLEKQYVFHQISIEFNNLVIIKPHDYSMAGMAASIRNRINDDLRGHNFTKGELSIINALLLGQREDISRETYNNYANAGAIHILAVSGLHIGIILFILQALLRPMNYIKYGHFYRAALILAFIWGFAVLAGLSASVTRAVTMFSAVTIAINIKRANNIYNTLAISAFLLLLIKPMFLFEVGFQLSYLAVLSIVLFQPIFYKWIYFRAKIPRYFWGLFTVTLAAQIGVAPLSLFYFHQFPGLFFISNLLILPFLGLILGLGILVIILALTGLLPTILAKFYGLLISKMNSVVAWVSNQESFIFQDISFNIYNVFASYLLIIGFIIFLRTKPNKGFKYVLLGLIAVQLVAILNSHRIRDAEFIIFNRSKVSVLAERKDSEITIHSNLSTSQIQQLSFIKDYKIQENISEIGIDSLKSIYRIDSELLLIVDSIPVFKVKSFKADIVLLRNSPKVNLIRLIDSLSPRMIIADGSNYKSYIRRWKLTSKDKKIPFHATAEKGAYIFKLNNGNKANFY